MKELQTKKGLRYKVDNEDFYAVAQLSWSDNGNGYLASRSTGSKVYLHRFIAQKMGLDLSKNIDHINQDRTDNRRANLRSASKSQNGANRPKPIHNTSGFKGVTKIKNTELWIARIKYQNKSIYIGVFDTKEDASRAYNDVAKKLFGEFA